MTALLDHETRIRRDIQQLVEGRMAELGIASWLDVVRMDGELFDGDLCPLINPGCPDDLCYLPAGHVGSSTGYHVTGTTAYHHALYWPHNSLAAPGTSREMLVTFGRAAAQALSDLGLDD